MAYDEKYTPGGVWSETRAWAEASIDIGTTASDSSIHISEPVAVDWADILDRTYREKDEIYEKLSHSVEIGLRTLNENPDESMDYVKQQITLGIMQELLNYLEWKDEVDHARNMVRIHGSIRIKRKDTGR
jgi:hypothetical protein